MFSPSEQFITQMKLRELRTQRTHALAAYDELMAQAAAAPGDDERVRVLYEGLRQLRFSKQPLHPDVANLELLLREIASGHVSTESLDYWRNHLERELTQGRLRAEIIYLFGALLEDWTSTAEQGAQENVQQRAALTDPLVRASQPNAAAGYEDFLGQLFNETGLNAPEVREEVRDETTEYVYASVTPEELQPILEEISKDHYRSPSLRSEARRFVHNDTLQRELSDALTILLDNIAEWSWPEEGVPVRMLWSSTKWRLFLDEELPLACLLALLGKRWQTMFMGIFVQQHNHRLRRLQRLLELGAPEIIIENERRMLASSKVSRLSQGIDIWDDANSYSAAPAPDAPLEEQIRYRGEGGSIYQHRSSWQDELRSFAHFDGYSGEVETGAMDKALTLLHTEIQLGRAAFPDQPLYVVKADLKDFYASLSHELLLYILGRLSFDERDVTFFRRYLAVPMQRGSDTLIAQEGVTSHRTLADMLGELVLRLLDLHVQRSARVVIVRMVDDIGLIAASEAEAIKAWQALQEFCRLCGLEINSEKCGTVVIGGGNLPEALPAGAPTWLHLSLDANGEWNVNTAAFDAYVEQVRQQILQAPSIIACVEAYNSAVAYFEHTLAIRAPLGASHRRSIADAIARFHYALFADTGGIVERVRRQITERFLASDASLRLPESWLYWPITAGGLGLKQSAMLVASYAESYAKRDMPALPDERSADWQRRSNSWSRFYAAHLSLIEPINPTTNAVMETLVQDFISRGKQLSGGKQQTLSSYWRWVLYAYGSQLLEHFGTFRFLFTELVPVQLITERYLSESEAEGMETDMPL